MTSPHTASVTAYLGSAVSWRWGSESVAISTNKTKDYFARQTNGEVNVSDTVKTFAQQTFETADTLIVGGYRSSGGVPNYQYVGKIYFFRVTDADGNLVVDWIPCKRLSDGAEGFWDCVSQTFIESI